LGNSWETTIPSGSGDLYLVSANASSKQARDAVGTSDWSNIRKFSEVGSGGFNSAPVYAYRRVTAGSSAPTTSPTTDRYYEFASGDWFASSTGGSALSTTIGNDWFTEIPTGSGDVYVVSSTASSANDRDLISSGEWGSIKTLATAGTNGTNGATGSQGATGAAGTNGTDGATGATGAAGTNGTNGSDAASWYSGSAYSIGDVVSYGASNSSKLYICIVAHSATGTVPTSNTSKWSEFVGVRDVSAGLVQTNSVQTNAITISNSALLSDNTWSNSTSWRDQVDVTFTCTGTDVTVTAGILFGAGVYYGWGNYMLAGYRANWRLLRIQGSTETQLFSVYNVHMPLSMTELDSPNSGSVTYKIQTSFGYGGAYAGGYKVLNTTLLAMETKR
jgi:hypothetical protein